MGTYLVPGERRPKRLEQSEWGRKEGNGRGQGPGQVWPRKWLEGLAFALNETAALLGFACSDFWFQRLTPAAMLRTAGSKEVSRRGTRGMRQEPRWCEGALDQVAAEKPEDPTGQSSKSGILVAWLRSSSASLGRLKKKNWTMEDFCCHQVSSLTWSYLIY